MSEYDSDIEFDFFDEQETGESPSSSRRSRAQPPPGGPPRHRQDRAGIPPTARLIGLIVFGILIVVLLVLWVQSCSSTSKKSSYQRYLGKVAVLAVDSNRIGSKLSQAIASPGIQAGALATSIVSLGKQQQVDVRDALRLKAPSGLASPHAAVVEALQFRVEGLRGIALALRRGAGSTHVSSTAVALAAWGERLVAGDVIWADRFRAATVRVVSRQNVTGLAVPRSRFLQDAGVDTLSFWTQVVERLNGNSTSGGTSGKAVGTQLLGVTAKPGNTQLNPTTETTVNAGTNLEFDVAVKNSGDIQVAGVLVTITITTKPKAISKTQTIPLINPGDTKTAAFKSIQIPTASFATQVHLTVDVKPVKGETNPGNNSASYPVLFSLTG
jgi:hypothetical protein